ncbi:TadE/TadG family type IV pilus assembly protein [Humisphaera borealis]|uniref:Pilus assembly protein n=1 Tax=Humisphaera borealis TaxID=2807512 RepID=A0A7M2WSK5_9BACT|nr:TadE family protein [Humisphaera borealis]QOV88399.1 pilus assembly protein [Humisphaera borealis]
MSSNRSIIVRIIRTARGDDGAAAVSFIMTFPLFLLIVAIIVQLALIVTAKIMISHAADTAARAAMTSLPEDKPDNVARAARLALTPICPEAKNGASSQASAVADALRQLGTEVPESFANRYTYAMEATQVNWTPSEHNYIGSEGSPVEVELTYQFRLTVPFAMRLVSGRETSVAGVSGRFWEVSARRQVQASHGRRARIDNDFWSR